MDIVLTFFIPFSHHSQQERISLLVPETVLLIAGLELAVPRHQVLPTLLFNPF